MPRSISQTHSEFDGSLNLLLTQAQEIMVKLDAPMLKGDNNRRTAKLKDAQLVSLVDLCPGAVVLLMNAKVVSGGFVFHSQVR